VFESLRCPVCAGTVAPERSGLRCVSCANVYPAVGGIVVLLEEAAAEIANWRHRVSDFLIDNDKARATLLAQLASDAKLDATRCRLEQLREHLDHHRQRLLEVLEPAGLAAKPRAAPERAVVPGEGSITSYYHQIHRDWSWEQHDNDEVAASVATVLGVLEDDANLGKMLVLGAGACRLSYELHKRATMTLATDINPLPFLVAKRLVAGDTVPLFELPVRPRDSTRTAIERQLRAERSVSNFHFLLADGLEPPVVDGSFDTVLTPWFIDQIPTNIAKLLPEIRRVLRDGGRWINHGPLVYHPNHTRLVHRYCFDEVLELTRRAGFDVRRHSIDRLNYMESPDGCQGRTELILSFCAIKTDVSETVTEDPAWLADSSVAVPLLPGIDKYEAPHPLFAAVAGMVDGERSIDDIVMTLVQQHGLPADAAPSAVQACLREIARKLAD
jgi:SAM-dependent methyltransferase